jgi:hypothetical protein
MQTDPLDERLRPLVKDVFAQLAEPQTNDIPFATAMHHVRRSDRSRASTLLRIAACCVLLVGLGAGWLAFAARDHSANASPESTPPTNSALDRSDQLILQAEGWRLVMVQTSSVQTTSSYVSSVGSDSGGRPAVAISVGQVQGGNLGRAAAEEDVAIDGRAATMVTDTANGLVLVTLDLGSDRVALVSFEGLTRGEIADLLPALRFTTDQGLETFAETSGVLVSRAG